MAVMGGSELDRAMRACYLGSNQSFDGLRARYKVYEFDVVLGLQVEPELRIHTERRSKANRGIRRDRALATADLVEDDLPSDEGDELAEEDRDSEPKSLAP